MKILCVHDQCPDFQPVKEKLRAEGVKFRTRDISKSIRIIKEFILLRGKLDDFKEIRQRRLIAVPALIDRKNAEFFE